MSVPIWIQVPGRPIPKPRMTRKDKWEKRPEVVAYRHYANNILEAYLKRRLEIGKFDAKRPVSMGFVFTMPGDTADLDNLIKGVKDALVGHAMSDDKSRVVRSYFEASVMFVNCEVCPLAYSADDQKLKRPKCKKRECPKQSTAVGFREIGKGD